MIINREKTTACVSTHSSAIGASVSEGTILTQTTQPPAIEPRILKNGGGILRTIQTVRKKLVSTVGAASMI
ncbi:uncharacterized protein LAJ45_05337 [Morchella importuna]|uniref:uncharacterized protein n=1 Tax=Morchella importuna TaxID=1174673 RepID=UPI001E8D7852|nr:uncharacterized protein LAJ45_05337 [Morchella importuna]KAH8150641.1 hypothetical protein LAJ45_05337 [Morchella importuna]